MLTQSWGRIVAQSGLLNSGVFFITAPAQPSATGLPCIRPCFTVDSTLSWASLSDQSIKLVFNNLHRFGSVTNKQTEAVEKSKGEWTRGKIWLQEVTMGLFLVTDDRILNGPLGRTAHSAAFRFTTLASLAPSIHGFDHSLRSLPGRTIDF